MRIALGLEYLGAAFRGWQAQPGVRTVQRDVEAALSKVADHPVKVICAGRTDAGVHASGQVIHFDTPAARSTRSWMLGTNSNLPNDIAIIWAQPVVGDFHARFSATSRRYRYVILNRGVRSGVLGAHVTWERQPLDEQRMARAASCLLGEHDFTSFRALACQARNPIRAIYEIKVNRSGDYVYIDVHANAFLYHMVRNIASALMTIGVGERAATWASELLQARDRAQGGITAPAAGLYFVHASYPERFGLTGEFSSPRYG